MIEIQRHRHMVLNLHRLTNLIDRFADDLLTESLGLTYSQFLILSALREHERVSQRQIADFLDVTEAAISRQVDILEQKTWLTRQPSETTRRAYVLVVTHSGQKITQAADRALDSRYEELFRILGLTEQHRLAVTADKLIQEMPRPSGRRIVVRTQQLDETERR